MAAAEVERRKLLIKEILGLMYLMKLIIVLALSGSAAFRLFKVPRNGAIECDGNVRLITCE